MARQVFGRMCSIIFSCISVEIVYSNFTFCGACTLSFLMQHTISAKRAHPRLSIPSGGNFLFAAVKSIDVHIAIIGNFVLKAKNSTVMIKCFGKTNGLFAGCHLVTV